MAIFCNQGKGSTEKYIWERNLGGDKMVILNYNVKVRKVNINHPSPPSLVDTSNPSRFIKKQ